MDQMTWEIQAAMLQFSDMKTIPSENPPEM